MTLLEKFHEWRWRRLCIQRVGMARSEPWMFRKTIHSLKGCAGEFQGLSDADAHDLLVLIIGECQDPIAQASAAMEVYGNPLFKDVLYRARVNKRFAEIREIINRALPSSDDVARNLRRWFDQ